MAVGTKELTELVDFGLGFGNALGKSFADDGKLTLSDAANFAGLIFSAPVAFQGISEVPAELADLSNQERDELYEHVQDKFEIENDDVEDFVESAIEFGLMGVQLFNKFKKIRAND